MPATVPNLFSFFKRFDLSLFDTFYFFVEIQSFGPSKGCNNVSIRADAFYMQQNNLSFSHIRICFEFYAPTHSD